MIKKQIGEIHMKSQTKALVMGSMTAFAVLSPVSAFATGVCYAFTLPDSQVSNTIDGGPEFVLRYIPTNVGALTSDAESRNFFHLKQQAYSLVGKVTVLIEFECPTGVICEATIQPYQARLMTTVDGSIITGRLPADGWSPDSPGAHMGVNVHLLRRVPQLGIDTPIGPAVLECTSSQTSATPDSWRCNLKADINQGEGGLFLAYALIHPFILEKVNANRTPACSVFQDGEPVIDVQ
jgi:hypothetical protein